MRNHPPSAIAAAWTAILVANPLANDVVRPWLETIATTTDPRKKREVMAWCHGAAQLAMIIAKGGEETSAASIAQLGRSWIERVKTDPDPFIYGPPRDAREKSLFGRRRSCSHISGILVRSQRAPRALMEFAGLPVLITRTVSAKPACE